LSPLKYSGTNKPAGTECSDRGGKAGDAGKGFAVVADEVRKLADQSRKSTEEINLLVNSIQEESVLAIESMEIMRKVSAEQSEAVNQTDMLSVILQMQ